MNNRETNENRISQYLPKGAEEFLIKTYGKTNATDILKGKPVSEILAQKGVKIKTKRSTKPSTHVGKWPHQKRIVR